MSKPPKQPDPLSEQAKQEWLEAMQDVEPYLQAHVSLPLPAGPPSRPKNTETTSRPPAWVAPFTANAKQLPPLTLGGGGGASGATIRKLKRGQMAISATLDLHGLTQVAAQDALQRQMMRSLEKGHRLLLVITGKGRVGQKGVLRESLPRWLNDERLRPYLLAFEPARREDGGLGAYYLLLRKGKKPPHEA